MQDRSLKNIFDENKLDEWQLFPKWKKLLYTKIIKNLKDYKLIS